MFEKVNPSHPDKVADRIAGAMVDIAYANDDNPRVAVEVLIGHGKCHIIAESSYTFTSEEVVPVVERIAGDGYALDLVVVPQDEHLADNQSDGIRCGDNGIFKGAPTTDEQKRLSSFMRNVYCSMRSDGKAIVEHGSVTLCQSGESDKVERAARFATAPCMVNAPLAKGMVINPLGPWTGGPDVDAGATNRKLGSDMGDAVTGGGLHGKDLSKADVSVNIFAYIMAQITRTPVEYTCAIGDETVDGIPYSAIVETAREYVRRIGGFERLAEWGLI